MLGLVHPHGDDHSGEGGQRGDDADGRADPVEVGEDPGEHGTDGEAAVAPQAVGADGAGAPRGVGDVADRSEQVG